MICPNCKNEKLEKDACPSCGLGERQAWEAVGDRFRREGRFSQAVPAYERVLALAPGDPEADRYRVLSLGRWAENTLDPDLYERAREAFSRILGRDWGWSEGHQARLRLYHRFGRLEELLGIYRSPGPEGEGEPIRAGMIQVIQLTRRFVEMPPSATTTLPDEGGWGGWLRVGLAVCAALLILGVGGGFLAHSSGPEGQDATLLLSGSVLILAGSFLILYSISNFLKGGKRGAARERKRLE